MNARTSLAYLYASKVEFYIFAAQRIENSYPDGAFLFREKAAYFLSKIALMATIDPDTFESFSHFMIVRTALLRIA